MFDSASHTLRRMSERTDRLRGGRRNSAVVDGADAHERGEPSTANPHTGGDEGLAAAWARGWGLVTGPQDDAFDETEKEARRLKREANRMARELKRKAR